MLAVYLFVLVILFSAGHIAYKRTWHDRHASLEIFLSYVLFFYMGVMCLLAAFAHVFLGPETAQEIGWQPGSPFQYEIGMANLSYGVLGILTYWMRGRFWDAACLGWSVLLLGCFVGHLRDYYVNGNTAPLNIGPYIWFYDLLLPLFVLALLSYLKLNKTERIQ